MVDRYGEGGHRWDEYEDEDELELERLICGPAGMEWNGLPPTGGSLSDKRCANHSAANR